MFPYLVRRIANYALLLFIATSLAYLLASASLDPANNWNREDPTLNWDAINASLIEYNISSELPVWDRYLSWFHSVALSWDWGSTPKGEAVNGILGTKIGVSLRLSSSAPRWEWSGASRWARGPPPASTSSRTA